MIGISSYCLLDQPLPVQYASWIGGLLQGDLGYSYVTDRPALAEILPRIPITARIGIQIAQLTAQSAIDLPRLTRLSSEASQVRKT